MTDHRIDTARHLVKKLSGPMGTAYACPFCSFSIVVPKGRPGCGRGYGLRTGGGAHSKLAAHIRAEHANKI